MIDCRFCHHRHPEGKRWAENSARTGCAPTKPPSAPQVLKAAMPVARAVLTRKVVGQLQMGPARQGNEINLHRRRPTARGHGNRVWGTQGRGRLHQGTACPRHFRWTTLEDNMEAAGTERWGLPPKRLHAPVAATMSTMMPAAGPPLAMAVGSSLQQENHEHSTCSPAV